MLVIIGIALSVCHTLIDYEIVIGYVYPVAQKEKRREETVERRKTLLKKQLSM